MSIDEIVIQKSDAMLATAWISYSYNDRVVSMGMVGGNEIKLSDELVSRIVVGCTTWNELMLATNGAPTAADLADMCSKNLTASRRTGPQATPAA